MAMAEGVPEVTQTQCDNLNACNLCGTHDGLSLCGGCRNAYYCSKTCQKDDWKQHKKACRCKKEETAGVLSDVELALASKIKSDLSFSKSQASDSFSSDVKSKQMETKKSPARVVKVASRKKKDQKQGYVQQGNIEERALRERYYLNKTDQKLALPSSLKSALDEQSKGSASLSSMQTREQYLSILNSRFKELAKYVVDCLTKHGVCVIDKFLGDTGFDILKEVIEIQNAGSMKQGQLVQGTSSSTSVNSYIRGDVITWVEGTESEHENIHFLVSCMDAVMIQCSNRLSPYVISERTKAMVACYPGGRNRYVKHVDNPNGDGRCITCIYYLNENWDVSKHGGLLCIYPEGEDRVANIEPKFDRLLYFWSDRRNPHEVRESYKERYAITVWYYDAEERSQALKRCQAMRSNSSVEQHK